MLLNNEGIDVHNGWREQQETLLSCLQSNNLHSLRLWIKERGQDYPAQTLNTHLFIPLRRRPQRQQPILQVLLGILDGVLTNYIVTCLASVRKRQGKDALVVDQNVQDTTRLWLEGQVASQQGQHIDVLAHSLNQLRPELFGGRTLLAWCGENQTPAQQQQLNERCALGYGIYPPGIQSLAHQGYFAHHFEPRQCSDNTQRALNALQGGPEGERSE